jgi:hypothetical protein
METVINVILTCATAGIALKQTVPALERHPGRSAAVAEFGRMG